MDEIKRLLVILIKQNMQNSDNCLGFMDLRFVQEMEKKYGRL